MNHVLTGNNIVKEISHNDHNRRILDEVSMHVKSGEFLTVMGPSGSGKSTLLFSLSGMDKIESGNVTFNGREITSLNDSEASAMRLLEMGFVFQQPAMLKNLNLIDNIMLPALQSKKRTRKDVESRAKALMDMVGIGDLLTRETTEVSGGELQRAGICRALINDPIMLFGDEPTGSLNSASSKEVISILKKINQNGTTILLVTHDPYVASQSDRILFMQDGRIVSELAFREGHAPAERERLVLKQMQQLGV